MGSIQFNEMIINMMLPTKICINFHIHVFHIFSRIQSFTFYFILFSVNFKFLLFRFKNYHLSFFKLSETLFAFSQLSRYFKSALTSRSSFLIELLRRNRLVPSVK